MSHTITGMRPVEGTNPAALSRIAREAGVGSTSFNKETWLMTLKRILGTCKREGFDILGEKIERNSK